VTAIKLTSVPPIELRTYETRGWTFFESTVIDGKAASARMGALGHLNYLCLGDDFEPSSEQAEGKKFLQKFCLQKRGPPRTPAKFMQDPGPQRSLNKNAHPDPIFPKQLSTVGVLVAR
jgi:hypothetical protein